MLSIPFGLIGGIWLVYWYGFNLSVAVVVGFIALAGVAAEIGILVLTFIDQAVAEARHQRIIRGDAACLTKGELMEAVLQGTAERVRPIAMTATAIIAGLLPILWGTGTGSEVMQRIAAPMVGGMVSVTVLCMLVLRGDLRSGFAVQGTVLFQWNRRRSGGAPKKQRSLIEIFGNDFYQREWRYNMKTVLKSLTFAILSGAAAASYAGHGPQSNPHGSGQP